MQFQINNLCEEEISLIFVTVAAQWYGRTERITSCNPLKRLLSDDQSSLRKIKLERQAANVCQVNLSKQLRANSLTSFKTRQTKVYCAQIVQFVSVDLPHEDNKHTLSSNKDLQPTVRSLLPSFMPQMSQQSSYICGCQTKQRQ